jgi:serine phosphatase RsbU (regulator of sigma subunit)
MRSTILPQLESTGQTAQRVEDLLQQARIICADAAERQQLSRLIDADRVTQVLADATRALVTSFDLPALRRALRSELPRLGIRSAYLLLYEGEGAPPETSRLVFAYDQERLVDVEGPGELGETTWLVGRQLLPERRTSFALMPLYFEDSQLGAVLFEIGPDNGVIYEALRELLSAALKGARLRIELAQEAAQREKAERERLAKELEIATHLQTSILPKDLTVEGLEVAAAMRPATEVGGDYYEVLPVVGGAWLCIGDVAGHGLRPGLVMVMLQSIVAAVVAHSPDISPKDMILVVNAVLYENVRRRLCQDEHATLSVMRYEKSGRLVFAGAHEDIIVFRSRRQMVETIETPGTWVAGARDIEAATVDSVLQLECGDVMLLYTDGVLEATNEAGEAFGTARLCREFERVAGRQVAQIRDHLMVAVGDWVNQQRDDIAVLVARQIA